jgi:antitoxin HigA-1
MTNGRSASSGGKEVQKMSNSSTTTELDLIEPIHPGEILMEDFIEGFGITQNKLAVSIGVPPRRINEIVHGKRGITADTALRLAKYFGTSAEMWMNLQSNYELRLERRALREQVEAIQPFQSA